MKLYICANSYTARQLEIRDKVIEVLSKEHEFCDDISAADYVVSLGGDGAVLKAFKEAFMANKPLLGINSGRLGFLCLLKQEELADFDAIVKSANISERSVLECELKGETHYALNDIVVSKVNFGGTVDLELNARRFKKEVRGDGLLISTPTGSSAYNLSAGGPLIDYEAEVLALTPICAHNSDACPLIIGDDQAVEVKVRHGSADIYVDGRISGRIDDGIIIRRSDRTIRLLIK